MATDTGVTVEGLDTLIARFESVAAAVASGLTLTVGSDVAYAPYVHEGTRRMAARPYLTTGAETALPALMDAVQGGLLALFESGNPGDLRNAFVAGGALVEAAVKADTPALTGVLRGSIRAAVEG